MKSSVVGLRFTRPPSQKSPEACSFLVNLIDSPGHVDFATEVSTAVRLSDAAILVVDVIEGVCPQTRSVLRQAWNERLTLILVLNKIDRLILELQLSPSQAYQVICRVIEQVNSVLAEMFAADIARYRDEAVQLSSTQTVEMSCSLQPQTHGVSGRQIFCHCGRKNYTYLQMNWTPLYGAIII